jgi:hypothetical protein
MAKKTNTESLAAAHRSQLNLIHFILGNRTSAVLRSSGFSNNIDSAALIYEVLAGVQEAKLLKIPGVNSNHLIYSAGRAGLSRELEIDFNVIRIFNANPIIGNFAQSIENGRARLAPYYAELVHKDFIGPRMTPEMFGRMFKRAIILTQRELRKVTYSYRKVNKSIGQTIRDLKSNLLTHYSSGEQKQKAKIMRSYLGSMDNVFGFVGELFKIEEMSQLAKIDQMIGSIFDKTYKEPALVPKIGNMSQLADVSMLINFGRVMAGSSSINVTFEVAPISLKTSKRDDVKTFTGFGGNPIPYMSPEIFSDFINIYLSATTSIYAVLGAMIADMALVSRTSATGEILFLQKTTPNYLQIYLMYELFKYYSDQKLSSQLPSLKIKKFNYTPDEDEPFKELNAKFVQGASKSVEKGRKFYSSVAKEKITRKGKVPLYLSKAAAGETTGKYDMGANLVAIYPPRTDRDQIIQAAKYIVGNTSFAGGGVSIKSTP